MKNKFGKKAKNLISDIDNGFDASEDSVLARAGEAKPKGKVVLFVILGLLILGLVVALGLVYKKYNDLRKDPKSAISAKNEVETKRVMESLKKHLLITETEQPTVARIEDPEKLKSSNKEFYKDIQKGDYLVIFPKRAIVYREKEAKIINIAPIINTADLKPAATTEPTPQTPTKK